MSWMDPLKKEVYFLAFSVDVVQNMPTSMRRSNLHAIEDTEQ